MLLSLLLAAEVAAATPAPTPPPVLTSGSQSVESGPADLSSVGGKVKVDRARAKALFQQDGAGSASASNPRPPEAAPSPARKDPALRAREEARWRERAARLRDALSAAQEELRRVEQSFPLAAYSVIATERREARLQPYRDRVERARADLDALPDDCRKAGCEPGWIR